MQLNKKPTNPTSLLNFSIKNLDWRMKKLLIVLILFFSYDAYSQTAEEYYKRGNAKSDLKDYYGAISDYTKAIELKPDYASAYVNRGNRKMGLRDYYGAISDFIKAIELKPDYPVTYYNSGISKYFLK